jgi:hypothetical protein
MYLVSEEKMDKDKTENPYNLVMSPYLKSIGYLDSEMKKILESDLDDNEKARLYTNALQKYLFHRFKYLEPKQEIKEMQDIEKHESVKVNRKKRKLKLKSKLKSKIPIKKSNLVKKSSNLASSSASYNFNPSIPKAISHITPLKVAKSKRNIFDSSKKETRKRNANIIASHRIKHIVQNEQSELPPWEKI